MIKKHLAYRIFFISILVGSCTSQSEEIIDQTNKTLPNGKHLIVKKTTRETTSTGYFTGHNYGTTRRVTYKFSIKQDAIDWDGGSGEPKKIIFYNDTVFVKYLKEKQITTTSLDSTSTPITTHTDSVQPVYEKHIDKRYFFNLFGDDYWSEITPKHYHDVQQLSTAYEIPNDNELKLEYHSHERSLKDSISNPVLPND